MEEVSHTGTRTRILAAAETLLAERGYSGTRLHEIARLVGVQKASLFHHFASKEELYRAVLGEGVDETERLIHDCLEGEGTPFERLRLFIEAYIDIVAAHPSRTKILLRQSLGEAPVGLWADDARRLVDRIVRYIEEQQAAHRFAPVDAHALVLSITGTVVFFFTTVPALAPGPFGRPDDPEVTGRIKAHVVDTLRRCLLEPANTTPTALAGASR